MRNSTYKQMRLAIFEKHDEGLISDDQRNDLFAYLEAQKEASELTPAKIEDFFGELSDMYPDLKKDIDKLAKKIGDAGEGGDDEGGGEESDDSGDDKEEVSEAVQELMDMIDSM